MIASDFSSHTYHVPSKKKRNSPHAIETVIRTVDCQHWNSRVCFRDASVALKDDDFRPNLIVDLRPLVQDFLNVLLQHEKQENPELCHNLHVVQLLSYL